MSVSNSSSRRPPVWMIIIIMVAMLPLLAFPALLSVMSDGMDMTTRTFVYFYPLYVIISGVCAWMCWPERKEVCWILIVLMLMSHVAMWMLAKGL